MRDCFISVIKLMCWFIVVGMCSEYNADANEVYNKTNTMLFLLLFV